MLNKSNPYTTPTFVLGIDLGTSGIRGVIVQKKSHAQATDTIVLSEAIPLHQISSPPLPPIFDSHTTQSPALWLGLLDALLQKLALSFDLSQLTQLIVDATSSTVLLCSPEGAALTPALMYNNQQASKEAKQIQQTTGFDPKTVAQGTSSTLAKVLFLLNIKNATQESPPHHLHSTAICHQVDFINHALCGCLSITDENNALKLGYDAVNQTWPMWIRSLLSPIKLPTVVAPGTPLGLITKQYVTQYGFSPKLTVHAGTTDSIAGFLASGASQVGDAVISLGSTLAIKLISSRPVFNQKYGIYSHKLNNNWLVGGASNTGGAVLLKVYNLTEIEYLIHTIHRSPLTNHDLNITDAFYPLNTTGERFPIADASLTPKMPQKPNQPLVMNDVSPKGFATLKAHQTYFLNLIKGLVYVEYLAYKRLEQVTEEPIKRLYSVGGGEKNLLWQRCRTVQFANQFHLKPAHSLDAAYGVTKLITE